MRVRIAWAQFNGAPNLTHGSRTIPIEELVHPGESYMGLSDTVVDAKSLQRQLLRTGIHLAGWSNPLLYA